MANQCPYCATEMETKRKETILQIHNEYDVKSIEQLNKMLAVFESLYLYFDEETSKKIKKITHNLSLIHN